MKFDIQIASGLFPENQYQKPMNFDYLSGHPEIRCIEINNIQSYFYDLVKPIKIDSSIDDWRLKVIVTIGGAMGEKYICMAKRGVTYPKTKEMEFYTSIPMPTNKEVTWGIVKKHRFNKYAKADEKYHILIPVDYNHYESMADYLETNIRIVLVQVFKRGITLKGHKIKL